MARVLWKLVLLIAFGYCAHGQTTTLNAAFVLSPPYLMRDDAGVYSGYLVDLFENLGYDLNITVVDRYGSKLPDGNFTGMVGEVVNKNVDVSGLLTVNPTRQEAIDFSFPVISVGYAIVMRKPMSMAPSMSLGRSVFRILSPFDVSLWIITFLVMLVTGIVLYLVSHFNPYEWRRMAKDREATVREAESFTCLNSFWFVVSALFLQGHARSPRSIGARVIVVTWWNYLLMFLFLYLACLTNFIGVGPGLLAADGFSQIRSLKDLSMHHNMDVGAVEGGSTELSLNKSSWSWERDLYQRILDTRAKDEVKMDKLIHLIDHLRFSKITNLAVIMESDIAAYYTSRVPCTLFMVPEARAIKHHALAFQKGSPYKDDINRKLVGILDSGVLRELEMKWFRSDKHCSPASLYPQSEESIMLKDYYTMDLLDFSGPLLLLVFGLTAGALIAIGEIVVYKQAESEKDE